MAWDFGSTGYAYYPAANWLDGVSSFSFSAWVKLNNVTTAEKQYLWSHRGITNQISLRKEVTNDRLKLSTTVGGAVRTREFTAASLSAGTLYHVAGAWRKNNALGIYLWIDGVEAASTTQSTTNQTVDYDSGGTISLAISAERDTGTQPGDAQVEDLVIVPNLFFDQAMVDRLYRGVPPHRAIRLGNGSWWDFGSATQSFLPDRSGNGRSLSSSTISGSPSGVQRLGRRGRWMRAPARHAIVSGSGGAAPNPWVAWPSVDHPATSATITGLASGVEYEVKMTATDTSDNVSSDSAVVSAFSLDAARHVPKFTFGA